MKALGMALMLSIAGSATARGGPAADSTAAGSDTLGRVVLLPEVRVSTTRADWRVPVARSLLSREELTRRNWGQDTPMALAALPGAYAYSDAGNGIGYSYLSIRGFPQRRISVLIDGVPLNDPESHEVYWIDHPDLLASTTVAQVQRGVGSALYGAASVGGTVDIETAPHASAPGFAVATGLGSYDTRRLMVEGVSGPLASGWSLYGRYSRIETDGYRERSDSRLWSYALSARRQSGAHTLSFNLFGGPEETHLAYLGIAREALEGGLTGDRDRDRRFNPLTYDGERDHFFEPHYELIHSWAVSPRLALTQTLFYFDGQGYYDERREGQNLADYRLGSWATSDSTLLPRGDYRDTDGDGVLDRDAQGRVIVDRFDLVRRRFIQDRHFGWIPRLRVEHGRSSLTAGGEIRAHDGHHVGTVVNGDGAPPGTEPDHAYYDYHPRTLAAALFAREEWRVRDDLVTTLDFAWRHQDYRMRGDRFDGVSFDQAYDFALPRLGIAWRNGAGLSALAAFAHSRREPAFRDLFDGEGVGGAPLLAGGRPLIQPERVNDAELGLRWDRDGLGAGLNAFRMDFRDELVYAGQFDTDLGYPILGNAARSVHQGLELEGALHWGGASVPGERPTAPTDRRPDLRVSGNLTLGDNHFVRYREVYGTHPGDTLSYDGKAIGFFPAALGNLALAGGWRGMTLGIDVQHAGRIYLDNTASVAASIAPRAVVDLDAGCRVPAGGGATARVSLRVFNLLDRRYETSGYMDVDAGGKLAPRFIPAATRHVLGEVRVEW